MTHDDAAEWQANAPAWTALSRAGYDVLRDLVNTPAFLGLLPPVGGLRGLDVGCGEGTNTRAVARLGAKMSAIDVAPAFVTAALESERTEPLGIDYAVADARALPFAAAQFDFAVAFMSLMDVPQVERALLEIARVLRPGGFLQFSILHPCFTLRRRRVWDGPDGPRIELSGYFERETWTEQWTFGAAPPAEAARWPKFRTPCYGLTLEDWFTALHHAGFVVERLAEPRASKADVAAQPHLAHARAFPLLLHLRCRLMSPRA